MNYLLHPSLVSKTREDIVKHFTDHLKEFQKLSKNIAGEDSDDLFQECTLMLLEFPEDRLISYWNDKEGLKPFFLRLLINQYKSKTSKFHKKYRKDEQFIAKNAKDIVYNTAPSHFHTEDRINLQSYEPIPEQDIDLKRVDTILANIETLNGGLGFPNELEDMIFGLYTETGSLRKTLAAIDPKYIHLFDLKTVHEIVKKFRRTIKSNLNIAA